MMEATEKINGTVLIIAYPFHTTDAFMFLGVSCIMPDGATAPGYVPPSSPHFVMTSLFAVPINGLT